VSFLTHLAVLSQPAEVRFLSRSLAVCGEEFGKIGTCRALQNKFTYRRDTNECISFNYSGCHGNNNLFDTKSICEKTCKV
ncbi:hypothetical protein KR215_006245, partial [Drosophila sulfurigaster]